MLGAIIGDIVGSVYEWNNIKTKDFPLFREDCFFTDDTVMTVATAEAVMRGGRTDDFIDAYKKWGRMYPDAGYGGRFLGWIFSGERGPYDSWGNGSAMRVSPCAWVMDCKSYAKTRSFPPHGWEIAARSAEVTHNHPEGVRGAQAVAAAIFLCRFYSEGHAGPWTIEELKAGVKKLVEGRFGYDLSFSLDEIRPGYRFDVGCEGSVPQAIRAFLESTDFEDTVRNAVSIGGDSDTLAAISGSIAEAAYGIPEWIRKKALSYLDGPILDLCRRWDEFLSRLRAT